MAGAQGLVVGLCRRGRWRRCAQRLHCGGPQAKHLSLSPCRPHGVHRRAAVRRAGAGRRAPGHRPHAPQRPRRAGCRQRRHAAGAGRRPLRGLSRAQYRIRGPRLGAGLAPDPTPGQGRQERRRGRPRLARQPEHPAPGAGRNPAHARMPPGRALDRPARGRRRSAQEHHGAGAPARGAHGAAGRAARARHRLRAARQANAGPAARRAGPAGPGRCACLARARSGAGARAQVAPVRPG